MRIVDWLIVVSVSVLCALVVSFIRERRLRSRLRDSLEATRLADDLGIRPYKTAFHRNAFAGSWPSSTPSSSTPRLQAVPSPKRSYDPPEYEDELEVRLNATVRPKVS